MNSLTMNNYSPAIYLSALRHSAGTAAARGAETRRETAKNAAAVRLTIAAVLQAAEDAAARRAPAPAPETLTAPAAPAPAQTAARPRFDLAEMVRRASPEYHTFIAIDPAARGALTWHAALRNAAADMRAETLTGTAAAFWAQSGDAQYDTLRRAASRVPAWSARAHYGADPETAAAVLPAARWTLYQSGTLRRPAAGDDRETVFRSSGPYAWMTPRAMGGSPTEAWNDAIDMVAAETWTRLAARREAGKDDPGTPYYLTIYRETMQAAAAIGRKSHDRPARQKDYTPSLDALRDAAGDAADPGTLTASRFPSPEAETLTRDAIFSAAGDDMDRAIMRALAYGWTQTETARRVHEFMARETARREGRTLTPEEIETAAAARVNQSTIARRVRAIADRLTAAGVLRDPARPGWNAHNPGPAPVATETVKGPGALWDWTRRPETPHNCAPVPAPAQTARETAPARPVPSETAPAVLPRPVWETRTAAPAPAPALTPAPDDTDPAVILRRVHANASPEAQTRRLTAAYREADRRASRSLERLASARREAETAARAADPETVRAAARRAARRVR